MEIKYVLFASPLGFCRHSWILVGDNRGICKLQTWCWPFFTDGRWRVCQSADQEDNFISSFDGTRTRVRGTTLGTLTVHHNPPCGKTFFSVGATAFILFTRKSWYVGNVCCRKTWNCCKMSTKGRWRSLRRMRTTSRRNPSRKLTYVEKFSWFCCQNEIQETLGVPSFSATLGRVEEEWLWIQIVQFYRSKAWLKSWGWRNTDHHLPSKNALVCSLRCFVLVFSNTVDLW